MSLEPDFGTTPLPLDEGDYLHASIRQALPEPIARRDIYLIEKRLEQQALVDVFPGVLAGQWAIDELISVSFLRDLHQRMFGKLWTWAGAIRKHELNIGVAPEHIRVEMKNAVDNILHRWQHTRDWTARELGIAVHAEFVRIHPFVDGNGRSTRMLADLVYVTVQGKRRAYVYDWDVDKATYLELVREYTVSRDPKPLAQFIPLHS